jgi:hypothetical protein
MTVMRKLEQSVQSPAKFILALVGSSGDVGTDLGDSVEEIVRSLDLFGVL